MRLADFYSLYEGSDIYYTIEPDGRLLEWELSSYSDLGEDGLCEDTSYEVVAEGETWRLIEELGRRVRLSSEDIDRIEYGLSAGCAVKVLREDGAVRVRI